MRALDLAREMGNKEEEVKCLMRLGLMLWNIGELEKSSGKYKQALLLAKKSNIRDKQEECQNALEICSLYEEAKKLRDESSEYQKSIEIFQRAIHLAQKIRSKEHEVKCLRQLSSTYFDLNKPEELFSVCNRALIIAKSLNLKREIGRCLNNIGVYYWKLDNHSKALVNFKDALQIAEEEKNGANEIACLNNIGLIYQEVGGYEKALEFLFKALSISKGLGFQLYTPGNLNSIGETYRRIGHVSKKKEDFDKAASYFKECLNLARGTGRKQIEVYALNNIGFLCVDLKKFDEALKYFLLGLEIAEELHDIEAISFLHNNMGIVNYYKQNYEDSIKDFQIAVEFANQIHARHILWEAYFGLGQSNEKLNNYSEALIFYNKSIDVIEHIMSRVFIDTHKSGFMRDKLKVYEHFISLLNRVNSDNPSNDSVKEIFHIVERAKARAFLESLGESTVPMKESLSPELKKKESEISNRISLIMQQITRIDLSKEKRKELLLRLQQEEDEYISLISKMRVEISENAQLISFLPCRVEEVQNILDKKTALIEYFLGENQSFVFLIVKDKFNVYPLPCRTGIEESLRAYLKVLSDPPKGKFKGMLGAERIYKELFYPFHENIPDYIENFIISPDGILYYLPFETLVPQSSEKKYLIEKYKISYVPSSSALLFLTSKKLNEVEKGLLAFGNPNYCLVNSSHKRERTDAEILRDLYLEQGFDLSQLPYSERELFEISKYFPKDKKDIYLKDEAKEEIFKKVYSDNYQIIHFACHGFLAEEFPFRSALVLSLDDDPREDGFLQVREIHNLRLKANLIVLSACQTGRGKLEKGEGVMGLPRVFFYAGARSVLSTLWKLNDESTAEFMNSFYNYLSQGENIAQALRLAKLKILNSKFYHPFYWAAFVLNGDYNSRLDLK